MNTISARNPCEPLCGRSTSSPMPSHGRKPNRRPLWPLLLPLAVIALPLLDMILAILRRVRRGQSPFTPDKEHLHHRLLQRGHSVRRAALLMYAWAGLVSFSAVSLTFLPMQSVAVLFLVGFAYLVYVMRKPDPSKPRGPRSESVMTQ